ncbi:uncharacterized protein [Argopecten irradians]|uniref:uncharacterized protein isoform X2 n=2 Tax=Argopecten irradians TaxID=31199 RepID=UPI00371B6477
MAADVTEKCKYSFNLTPSCYNAVKWSRDGRIAIATNECVFIMELEYSPHQLVSSSSCHVKSIPALEVQYNMSGLDENEFRDIQEKTKSPDLKQELALDHTLCPLVKSAHPHTGYRTVCWSPLGGDNLQRCILATLSHDHQLLLHSAFDTQSSWKVVADLSSLYLENSEWNTGDPKDIHYLRTKMHSVSALEIAWTPAYGENTVSCLAEAAILSVAMRNGDVLLWHIKFPCYSREQCRLLKKMTFTSTCPSAIAWLQKPVHMPTGTLLDYMVTGYQDGTVVMVVVNLKNGDVVSSISLHSDQDSLAVIDITIKQISKDQILVLLVKEYYLMVYVVNLFDDKMVLHHTTHVQVETELNITAVRYKDETLLLSTCDGFLFRGNVVVTNKGVSVNLQQWNTSFTTTDQNKDWHCYGVDMSDNAMLFSALLVSSKKKFDALKIRMFQKQLEFHIQPLHQETEEISRLQKRVQMMIENQTVPLTLMVDVMETFRIHLWQGKDLATSVTTDISNPSSWYSLPLKRLRVLRYFLITITLHIPRSPDSSEENEEVAYAEKNIQKLRQIIIGRYIVESLQLLQSRKEMMQDKDRYVCSCMLQFLKHHQHEYIDTPLHAKMETLGQLFKEIDTIDHNCCICGETAVLGDNFTITCKEGHTFGLCCQTFQPLMDTSYRNCCNCKVQSVSCANREGLFWLVEPKNYCTICENYLFPCI